MQALRNRLIPQPLVSISMSALALMALVETWLALRNTSELNEPAIAILAVGLVMAVVIADLHLIHVNYHTKASFSTLGLYLIAVLLPPPMAITVAGLGKLISELIQPDKGNLPSDIATCVSRWMIVVLLTALVAQLPTTTGLEELLVLVGAAVIMFIGDLVTSALELGPIAGERPWRIISATFRETAAVEAILYSLAIFGALAAMTHLWGLVFLILPVRVAYVAFKHTKEMHESTRRLLESMADAVDLRDPYTGGHSRRVTAFSQDILRELALSGPDVDLIVTAARVHDIGKIGIPDTILHKTGALTAEEWTVMQSHAARGAEVLARYPDFARGVAIVRHHHERWDGKGYPDGLAGQAIPFGARVIAVADSFDAMTSDRPYRPGMPIAKAAEILRKGRNEQWDEQIVDAFLRYLAPQLQASLPATIPSTLPVRDAMSQLKPSL